MIFVSEDDSIARGRSFHCEVDTFTGIVAVDAAGYGHEYDTKLWFKEPMCMSIGEIWSQTGMIWILRNLSEC